MSKRMLSIRIDDPSGEPTRELLALHLAGMCENSPSEYVFALDLSGPMAPGERRQLGFVFLSGEEAAAQLRRSGRFFLWEGRFIGEGIVRADHSG
ncbi:MAG: hypothetical protein WBE92_13425 [Steroidobacteraceae bacterium]